MLGPGAAAAWAAGPGVKLYSKANGDGAIIAGGSIAAMSTVGPRTYSVPTSAGSTKQVSLRAVSLADLLRSQGIDPAATRVVDVVLGRSDSRRVGQAQLAGALVSDDGRTTRFFRSTGGASVTDYVESTAVPIELYVDGGADLVVAIDASTTTPRAGRTVTLTARIQSGSPTAQYSYDWDYGDGEVDAFAARRTTHVYELGGSMQVTVEVRNLDSDCKTACGGLGVLDLRVGAPPPEPKAPEPSPGAGVGSPNVAGTATGTGAGGRGGTGAGSGSGSGSGSARKGAHRPSAQRKPKRATPPPAKPFGVQISGVLIDEAGEAVRTLPAAAAGGAAKGLRAARGGDGPDGRLVALWAALAAAVLWLGALRERRAVRLRVA